jgi:hypothetical protein
MSFDSAVQWLGTVCLLGMYLVMSFWPHLYPLNIALGLAGSMCYLLWAIHHGNWPQITVNIISISICTWGLALAWG